MVSKGTPPRKEGFAPSKVDAIVGRKKRVPIGRPKPTEPGPRSKTSYRGLHFNAVDGIASRLRPCDLLKAERLRLGLTRKQYERLYGHAAKAL